MKQTHHFANVNKLLVIIWSLILTLSQGGCLHLTHSAKVRPGVQWSVTGGRAFERYEPPNDDNQLGWGDKVEGQITLGLGGFFKNGHGLLFQGTLTSYLITSGLSLYWQFRDESHWPLNIGIGSVLSLGNAGIYVMAGKSWQLSNDSGALFEFNSGFSVTTGEALGLRPQIQINYIKNKWRFGFLISYSSYSKRLILCFEQCDDEDYLANRVILGLTIGRY